MPMRADVERMATVLQADAESRLYTSRTKAHVIALDKTDHHAVFICGTQINRAAFDGVASTKVLRFFHIDQLGAAF